MSELDRIEYELRKAGFTLEEVPEINSDEDYSQAIGTSVWKVCKEFLSHGHSGYSAGCALNLIKVLLVEGKPLSHLTNNPDEWTDITELSAGPLWQSKRDSSCFSNDGLKTYYDIDDPDNREWELDENGKKTGWSSFVGMNKCKKVGLLNYTEEKENA